MYGATRQIMLENDYVQHGAFKAGVPATHTGKIKYPQVVLTNPAVTVFIINDLLLLRLMQPDNVKSKNKGAQSLLSSSMSKCSTE
jgi:hypothetical protein